MKSYREITDIIRGEICKMMEEEPEQALQNGILDGMETLIIAIHKSDTESQPFSCGEKEKIFTEMANFVDALMAQSARTTNNYGKLYAFCTLHVYVVLKDELEALQKD